MVEGTVTTQTRVHSNSSISTSPSQDFRLGITHKENHDGRVAMQTRIHSNSSIYTSPNQGCQLGIIRNTDNHHEAISEFDGLWNGVWAKINASSGRNWFSSWSMSVRLAKSRKKTTKCCIIVLTQNIGMILTPIVIIIRWYWKTEDSFQIPPPPT